MSAEYKLLVTKCPKVWEITATLRSPKDATEEDVRGVLRRAASSLSVKEIKELKEHFE